VTIDMAAGRGLDADQVRRFHHDGYLVVDDVLDPERDIAPVHEEYAARLDDLVELLLARGDLSDGHRDVPFPQRMTEVWLDTKRDYAQWFDITIPPAGVRADTPVHTGPAVFALLTNPRLLDVVSSILGPEIFANPVQHIRMKLPRRATIDVTRSELGAPTTITAAAPWHQDNGVYVEEADDTDILTVWLPLNEATVANGCLRVVPRTHDELVPHCVISGIATIPDEFIPFERAIPLPMRPGSVLLMDKRTIHGALDNESADQVRLSFDLRYGRPGEPTGRPNLDEGGFLARSAAHPDEVLDDPAVWSARWVALRDKLAAEEAGSAERWAAPRWDLDAEWCA
jgi:hypothetical protein